MSKFPEHVLGPGTPVGKEMVRLIRKLGPETEHIAAETDPSASRKARIDSRREWPDSPTSDVPDRFPLFQLLGDVDLMVWPELGTAVDTAGTVAAHLLEAGQWIVVAANTVGEVVTKQLASGGHIARIVTRPATGAATGEGFDFKGPTEYLDAVRRSRGHIAWLHRQASTPKDRGG